jgi:hypothetical protein
MKKQKPDPIDSWTGSHQDEENSGFIDLIDPASNNLSNQLRFFLNQLRLRRIQCSRSDHIMTIVDSLKSEHTPDCLHVASGQLWSFKLIEDISNRLRARSDYHSILKDGSHDQAEQDVKDFYWIEESPVTYGRDTSVCKTKIEAIGWFFHIEHITNPVTSVKKDTKQKDEVTILSKMKLINLVRTEASDQWLSIHR